MFLFLLASDVNHVIQPVHVVLFLLLHVVLAGVLDGKARLVLMNRLRELIATHQIRPIVRPRRVVIIIRHIGHTADEAARHDLVENIRQFILVKHHLELGVTPLIEDVVTVALVHHVPDVVDHQRFIAQDLAAVAGHDERVERHFCVWPMVLYHFIINKSIF